MSLKILILEDHRDTRLALMRFLERRGHTVIETELLSDATEKLSTGEVDGVISDINLPDGSGLDLLRNADPQYPLYAITISANGTDADKRRSAEAGFKRHLVKPVSLQEIENFLATVTALSGTNTPDPQS
ncbi:MAG TPA: response regulator [Chthoniobacterales bacterium]|jgi:DNA-binding response OmpR family regulator|nr:response regulator [Chthoniobacterales bacterium]